MAATTKVLKDRTIEKGQDDRGLFIKHTYLNGEIFYERYAIADCVNHLKDWIAYTVAS